MQDALNLAQKTEANLTKATIPLRRIDEESPLPIPSRRANPRGHVRRYWRCDSPGHVFRDCPIARAGKRGAVKSRGAELTERETPKKKDRRPVIPLQSKGQRRVGNKETEDCVGSETGINKESSAYRVSSNLSLILSGRINKVPCAMVVDTGAARTIVNSQVLDLTGALLRPSGYMCLRAVSGDKVPVRGVAELSFDLGDGQARAHPALVADIQERCILGLDFLVQQRCLLDLAAQTVIVDGHRIVSTDSDVLQAIPEEELSQEGTGPMQEFRGLEIAETLTAELEEPRLPKHLQKLNLGPLEPDQARKVRDLIIEFANLFAKDAADLGKIAETYHSIDVGDTHPIIQAPRRIPPGRLAEVDKLVT